MKKNKKDEKDKEKEENKEQQKKVEIKSQYSRYNGILKMHDYCKMK